jgi:hypothetical protein
MQPPMIDRSRRWPEIGRGRGDATLIRSGPSDLVDVHAGWYPLTYLNLDQV